MDFHHRLNKKLDKELKLKFRFVLVDSPHQNFCRPTWWGWTPVLFRQVEVQDWWVGDVGQLHGDDDEDEEVLPLVATPAPDMLLQNLIEVDIYRMKLSNYCQA